jgi:streptomycin 6-kinase
MGTSPPIDPKGVIAELEFELGAILRNPRGMPELFTASALERRARQLANGLGVDPVRVIRWTFVQAVLSAIWSVEDGKELRDDEPVLRVARSAWSLMP